MRMSGLCLVISAQFALEMCIVASNRQKSIKNHFSVQGHITGHCCRCQSRASVRLPISD